MKPLTDQDRADMALVIDDSLTIGKPPAFPFYVADWLGSGEVGAMLPEQEGGYIRLMAVLWASDRLAIPSDPKRLAMISRLGERWTELGPAIIECFSEHPTESGKLTQRRLLRERAVQVKRRLKNQANAKGTPSDGKAPAKPTPSIILSPLSSSGSPPTVDPFLQIGGDVSETTPPDEHLKVSPPDPKPDLKAEENAKAVQVRNWFASCYRKINGTDLPGFDPSDRRMSVQDRNACKGIYALYGNGREGKPGYVSPEVLRQRLYNALAGNYYKIRPPANIAEFKRILSNCVDSALRPSDQRKSIPNVPARPKVNETPGAERKRYADPDPWAEWPVEPLPTPEDAELERRARQAAKGSVR